MDIVPQESPVDGLYNRVKDTVWVLKFEGTRGGESWSTCQTAFAVAHKGLLISCAHGDWPSWSNLKVKARPTFDTVGFRYEAYFVMFKPECDVAMFLLKDTKISSIVTFGSGKVQVGEPIFLLGHPSEYIGSGILGMAAYPCLENVTPFDFEGLRCENYRCRVKSKTPTKRIMGHVWNKAVFNAHANNKNEDFEFEKSLLSSTPVVQAYGLVGGGGASGAPLFNRVGEVIGMLVSGVDGFEIGIHVSVLQQLVLLEAEISKKKKKIEAEISKKKKKTGKTSKEEAAVTSKKRAVVTSKKRAAETIKEEAGESSKKAGETSKKRVGEASSKKRAEAGDNKKRRLK